MPSQKFSETSQNVKAFIKVGLKHNTWNVNLVKVENKDEEAVRLDGQEILERESFQFLESIIHKDKQIEKGVNYRIKTW